MQIVSAVMCWRQATVRPLKSEAATAVPNEVVIGVVHAIHSSSAASITQVHQPVGEAWSQCVGCAICRPRHGASRIAWSARLRGS